MVTLNLNDADDQLKQLVEAALRGEDVRIVDDKDRVVQLVPKTSAPPALKARRFGSASGLIAYMADDFDEPLEDFKEYME
jgi:antitoxin (DNA-binding transcriptional repressor) of toxin-antitoxin stability system